MRFWNKKVESDEARGASCSSRTSRRFLTRASRPTTRNPSRRGILLLVALSLLVLFLLVGTAFVVTARHSSRTAKTVGEANRTRSAEAGQADLLDNVLKQIVRDTNNPNSSLRFHSLLRDMYGNDGFTGVLPAPTVQLDAQEDLQISTRWAPTRDTNGRIGNNQTRNVTQGQILEFDILGVEDLFGNEALATNPQGMKQLRNAYNGMTLTFTSGNAKGVTTRIVGYIPADLNDPNYPRNFARFRLLSFKLADGSTLPMDNTTVATAEQADFNLNELLAGSRFVVNGRPFNGTGVGYDPFAATGDARLSTQESGQPLALLPNTVYFDPGAVTLTGGNDPRFYFPNNVVNQDSPYFGIGGSDEGYDAADFQNMLMGLMPQVPGELAPSIMAPGTSGGNLGNVPIPSLHRPALVNYWAGQSGIYGLNPHQLRKTMLRPSWFDHPEFTGSNPERAADLANFRSLMIDTHGYDLANIQGDTNAQMVATRLLTYSIYGPWDVDNDNDGVRDSVWVDFGAPVMSMPGGTLVKPLAAILCLDMDGRLNVNAHASSEMIDPWGYGEPMAGGQMSNTLPSGSGMGPAEISLLPLFAGGSGTFTPQQSLNRLLGGSNGGAESGLLGPMSYTGQPHPGRYGDETRPGPERPGTAGVFDLTAQLSMQGTPVAGVNTRSAYGTTPDFKGRYATALNDFGQPINEALSDGSFSIGDNPYELDLFTTTGVLSNSTDSPFTLTELERILRAYDVDAAAAPDRLANLGEFLDPSRLQQTRNLVTTDSWDLPVPSGNLPSWVNETTAAKLDLDPGSMPPTPNDSFQAVMGRPPVGASFADLIEYRFRAVTPNKRFGSVTANVLPLLTAAERRAIANLIPRDLANGTKLDINRALGNGRDDDNDGVVDEPGEVEQGTWQLTRDMDQSQATNIQAVNPGVTQPHPSDAFVDARDRTNPNLSSGIRRDQVDLNNDGDFQDAGEIRNITLTDPNNPAEIAERVRWDNLRRQELAKDLYITALALVDPFATATDPQKDAQQAKCRRIAQWAINTVDFRDPDSSMTGFEYDVNPFDGWDVDGNLGTTDDVYGPDNMAVTRDDTGGQVWGVEQPELLITEVVAWHDRATQNEADDDVEPQGADDKAALSPSGAGQANQSDTDLDFDQKTRPQGVCLIELYNPNERNPAASGDTHLLNAGGGDMGVDLAKVDPSGTSPLWRIAVYAVPPATPYEQTFIRDPDAANPADLPGTLERTVYFAGFDPQLNDGSVAYFNDPSNSVRSVRPQRYMVIGAGKETAPGSDVFEAHFGGKPDGSPGERRVILRPNSNATPFEFIEPLDNSRSLTSPPDSNPVDARASLTDVAVINRVLNKNLLASNPNSTATSQVNFTLSEPLPTANHPEGYPNQYRNVYWDPDFVLPNANPGAEEFRGAYLLGPDTMTPKAIDIPLDDNPSNFPGGVGANLLSDYPDGVGTRIGYVPAYRWIYLQRLANPMLPWNPPLGQTGHDPNRVVNPYLTVDSSSASMTVFNGRAANFSGTGPQDEFPGGNGPAARNFLNTERGWKQDKNQPQAISQTASNIWSSELPPLPSDIGLSPQEQPANRREAAKVDPNQGFGADSHLFNAQPKFTLGFLNQRYQNTNAMDLAESRTTPLARNSDGTPSPVPPFQWLTWNDRPYISSDELMQVSTVSSSKLMRAVSMPQALTGVAADEAYEGNPRELEPTRDRMLLDGPFSHLANFYRTETGANGTLGDTVAGLHRVLDYLHVPSRYVGTEEWLNPNYFNGLTASADDPRHGLQVPFNRVSSFREPGQVNVNTMADESVYEGLMHGDTRPDVTGAVHPGPTWGTLRASRRGYGVSGDAMLQLDPDYPTFFSNPLRAADASDLVPKLTPTTSMVRKSVHSTMLRSGDIQPANPPTEPPLFAAETSNPYDSAERNSYFRYQPTSRLENLSTTRSNVYSVWITVGFFEVEPAPTLEQFRAVNDPTGTLTDPQIQALYERVYPEGYQLGREYGIDVGKTRRLRGFSIVDRSIPVGFEPGYDHNSHDVVRLQRQVE